MAVDNLVDVMCVDVGVPNTFWINDDARTFVTPVKAAGFIDADVSFAVQIKCLDPRFRMLLHAGGVVPAAARSAIFALVKTEKDVTLVIAHAQIIGLH